MNHVIPADTRNADELARQLAAQWAPARPVVESRDEDYDQEDECTGYGGCDCSRHVHDERVRTARCQLGRGTGAAGCDRPTRYRLRLWRPGGGTRVQRKELGLTERPDEWTDFGEDRIFLTGSERYACDKPHAHQLAEHLRERYARPDDTELTRWRVLIEPWRYEPDAYDLDNIGLVWLADLGRSIGYDVAELVDLVNPHTVHRSRDARFYLDTARRRAAELVRELAKLDTRPLPQRHYVGSIPLEVQAVQSRRDGGDYIRRRAAGLTHGWYSMDADRGFASDDELLAAYPEGLYEPQGSELVPMPDEYR